MKKILLAALIVLFGISLTSGAYAYTTLGTLPADATVSTNFQSTMMSGSLYSPSTNVTVGIDSIATSYCGVSQHYSARGSSTSAAKQYATSSADPATRDSLATDTGQPTPCVHP